MRPRRNRINTIRTTSPRPPLGQYPQFLLYGHDGTAPIKRIINTINRINPMTSHLRSRVNSVPVLFPCNLDFSLRDGSNPSADSSFLTQRDDRIDARRSARRQPTSNERYT